MNYPTIFQPIPVAGFTLDNRIIMGSMHTNLEEQPGGFDRLADFYIERVRGGVGLIVTGGVSPDESGVLHRGGCKLTTPEEVAAHRKVTDAVHTHGGRICMQILHSGRYGFHEDIIAPSAIQAPISKFTPTELDDSQIESTIASFVKCSLLAKEAGYDGVEVLGAGGYLISEFLTPRTNKRTDQWGGCFDNRARFPLEIVRRIREAAGDHFIIMFRFNGVDLVEDGNCYDENLAFAQDLIEAGVSILNVGIGWHEARVPTVVSRVPRAAWSWVGDRYRRALRDTLGEHGVPIVVSGRINTPEDAERIVAAGEADMISMSRPFLADAHFVRKAREDRADEICICVGCNQACLDHYFTQQVASCMVNPFACREGDAHYKIELVAERYKVAVIGGGPAGLSAAITAAELGHEVSLFEAGEEIGGQFRLASKVPGKEDFADALRYYQRQIELNNIELRLNTWVTTEEINNSDFDQVIIATGVKPRIPPIEGVDHPKVFDYSQLLSGQVEAGQSVAVIGSGGVGFDVCEYLAVNNVGDSSTIEQYLSEWGVDKSLATRGGLAEPKSPASAREISLLQRKPGMARGVGVTSGWVKNAELAKRGVRLMGGCEYLKIDDEGLHLRTKEGTSVLRADTIVLCAGQEAQDQVVQGLEKPHQVIGGARDPEKLDAVHAIAAGADAALALGQMYSPGGLRSSRCHDLDDRYLGPYGLS